jgi:hypothetical protein
MDTIDKDSMAYLRAVDARVEAIDEAMEYPSDASVGAAVSMPKPRRKSEEISFFLKSNTLSVLERLHNIATDSLYTRANSGERIRTSVPAGVQLQAAIAFLDRAMGKPQVSVDLQVSERPIMFDATFSAPPLIQGTVGPVDNGDSESVD